MLATEKLVTISTALTVQAAAYATADVMGGKVAITLPKVHNGQVAGTVIDALLVDKGVSAGPYELLVFHTNPAASTFTENGAITIADADLPKLAGSIYFPTAGKTAFADNGMFAGTELAATTLNPPSLNFVLPEGVTTIYVVLVARSAPTPASTSDLTINLTFALATK